MVKDCSDESGEIQAKEMVIKLLSKKVRSIRKLAYKPERLASLTSTCRGRIYQAMNDGSLVARKFGTSTLIMHEDAMRWLKSLPLYKEPEV